MHSVANFLEALLDLIDFGIILAHRKGSVVAANAVAREIAGPWSLLSLYDAQPGALPVLSHTSILDAAPMALLARCCENAVLGSQRQGPASLGPARSG